MVLVNYARRTDLPSNPAASQSGSMLHKADTARASTAMLYFTAYTSTDRAAGEVAVAFFISGAVRGVHEQRFQPLPTPRRQNKMVSGIRGSLRCHLGQRKMRRYRKTYLLTSGNTSEGMVRCKSLTWMLEPCQICPEINTHSTVRGSNLQVCIPNTCGLQKHPCFTFNDTFQINGVSTSIAP